MNRCLLVEGESDFHVIKALSKKFEVKLDEREINSCGGTAIRNSLSIRIKADYSIIGIVIDADQDIKVEWTKIKEILESNGYDMPEAPLHDGTIVSLEDRPTVGVWVMPNNDHTGMLEDFVEVLIPDGDILKDEANKVLDELEAREVNSYDEKLHRTKALINTWLAWQKHPGTPMGLAITKKYLETDRELCDKFVRWLKMLFN